MVRDWQHGGALDLMKVEFPHAPRPWIDLSTGINPWPFHITGLSTDVYARLPTQEASSNCADALSENTRAPRANICLAAGSELLIRLLPHFLPCRRIAILSPTYGDYSDVWRNAEREVLETDDPLSLAGSVDAVILCNPNNPNGRQFTVDSLLKARRTLADREGWLIVDEAYCDLTPELSLAPYGGSDGLIILRSFGKFYGLPGLRLGALIAPNDLVASVSRQLGAWPVSSGALEIAARAFRDQIWQTETRSRLQTARRELDRTLISNGLNVIGGTDLFRFVQVENAHMVWRHLAQAGIYVRHFETIPDHLRIGVPKDDSERSRLEQVLSLLG